MSDRCQAHKARRCSKCSSAHSCDQGIWCGDGACSEWTNHPPPVDADDYEHPDRPATVEWWWTEEGRAAHDAAVRAEAEQSIYNAAYIKGRRDYAAEVAQVERSLRERVEAALQPCVWGATGTSTCLELLGTTFENGIVWVEAMCCQTCQVRAALADQGGEDRG